jgi:hypothetical protein
MKKSGSQSGTFVGLAVVVCAAMATGYTVTAYNNASWVNIGNTADTLVANSSGYLPMTSSDCPKDSLMKYSRPYTDKIFNGCLDDCGDGVYWGHGSATVIDWNHRSVGQLRAAIMSNLHGTGIWPPDPVAVPDPPVKYPPTLVFWIKGAVGNEDSNFVVALDPNGGNLSTTSKLPIHVTTSWQRVVIPWNTFVLPSGSSYAKGIVFAISTRSKKTIFIDQAYYCIRNPPATGVVNPLPYSVNAKSMGRPAVVLGNPREMHIHSSNLFDFSGKSIHPKAHLSGYQAYIVGPTQIKK